MMKKNSKYTEKIHLENYFEKFNIKKYILNTVAYII